MKLFTFVIIAMMLSGIALAAEVPTDKGDKAMVFMFHGFDALSLEGYGGHYGIGLRYYFADMTAIRGGVEFGTYSLVQEHTDDDYADDENNYSIYGARALYEKHMEGPCPSVSPYWGLGFAFAKESDEYIEAVAADGSTATRTFDGTGFAGLGVLGFEWAFTNCMTLGGEYELGFWNWSGEVEQDDAYPGADPDYSKYTETWMGFHTASVYLSVYW